MHRLPPLAQVSEQAHILVVDSRKAAVVARTAAAVGRKVVVVVADRRAAAVDHTEAVPEAARRPADMAVTFQNSFLSMN